jgi:hypothetical protein
MIVPFVALALSALPAAAPPPSTVAVGLDGAPVGLAEVTALVVDPDDRDQLKATLQAVRAQATAAGLTPGAERPQAMVVVVDLSDVPSFLHDVALDRMRARVAEAQQRPMAHPIPLSFVPDMNGSLSRQLSGPLDGSCFVVTDARGAHVRGVTVAALAVRVAAAGGAAP